MRLGLLSTMAALLACNGLALGQAPVTIVQEQAVEGMPPSQRGYIMPVSAVQIPPAGATMPAAPAPAPIPLGATNGGHGDLTTSPAVLEEGVYSNPQDYHYWTSFDFILWRFGSLPLPTFQAVVPAGNIDVNSATATVQPGAATIITPNATISETVQAQVQTGLPGGSDRDLRDQPGVRINIGCWLDNDKTVGIDGGFFWLFQRTQGITNNTSFFQTLEVPGVTQSITTLAPPTSVNGTSTTSTTPVFVSAGVINNLTAEVRNQIWGAELNARTQAGIFGGAIFDLLVGVRYIQVDQDSIANQTVTIIPNGPGQGSLGANPPTTSTPPANVLFGSTATLAAPVSATFDDSIFLKNYFVGAQIGASVEWRMATNWFVTGYGKLAIGDLHSVAELSGSTTGPTGTNGGLLVSPSDNGTSSSVDRVCFVPEGCLALTWRIAPHVYVSAAYNVIYFSTMAKVGNVTTPTNTNATLTFGTAGGGSANIVQPGFRFTGGQTTLQGCDLGIEFRF